MYPIPAASATPNIFKNVLDVALRTHYLGDMEFIATALLAFVVYPTVVTLGIVTVVVLLARKGR